MTDATNEHGRPCDTEAVGYGKPPTHSQFKKGQPGNPKGRPRGKRNMASLVSDVLAQKVTITANGKRKRVSSETALLLRLREKALGGDLRALQILLSLRATHIPDTQSTADHRLMAVEDIAILASAGLIELPETNNDGA
jgi:hypothetical protein